MPQNQTHATTVGDVLKDSLAVAIGEVVHSLEPQLNDIATRYTHEAIDRSRAIANIAVRQVRNRPWFLVGAAALLLIGAAIVFGIQREEQEAFT